ncbi:efflux RND transporter periplasmic adaptor subunit [Sinorhizobium alkalisoli]|uniref:Efflux transporter periplasmic adaptor subunit n=1 Tax=Sinorhizobium alkalisoli TaxID=1752398 RepID=A0A1E3VH48_9HYPH|nr:efflux RND transporter periplasmic adaptor subunit [Sinorhizobium alkalisoli]MCA1491328.1 efflux RND transporter periplasmic adaptor subunit [Ensifer sp. NBAIM29]MCG5478940.1 efflux RND transporter periplasmic adaptor subunit [Sinorhizobium alkalisoli]ODR92854.1 efflux transporter periplasmic adaptor subunit [Sinorhizobium alkalisoli]QFI70376.1 RND efflux membrane fusion protein [Sinorhizobium alkalisoli]
MSFTSVFKQPFAGRLLGVAALAALLAGCSEEKAETKEIIRPVKVVEIAGTGETRRLVYAGAVKARTEMNLGFRVGGKITERLVDIGDRVEPGDVLARLDPTDYELSVKSAEANLLAADKQVQTVALTKTRAEQLFARKFSSRAELDQASLAYDQAVSTRDAAASALSQARNQVTYTRLLSDQPGIITAINADIGQVVGTGTPVVTVAIDGEKEIEVAVPELDIAEFKPGKEVQARFWSNDMLTLEGRVREVSGSAERQSRTFSVRISLPDDRRVLLGMTATVEAAAAKSETLISIPLSALARKDDKDIVWTVDRDASTVHARAIRLADFTGDQVRVAEGLAPGDLVVTAGTQFMTEDLKVKLRPDAQQSASAGTQIVR